MKNKLEVAWLCKPVNK